VESGSRVRDSELYVRYYVKSQLFLERFVDVL